MPEGGASDSSVTDGGAGDRDGDGIVQILPFGDSITELGCWRYFLYRKLRGSGYKNVDFVGTRFDGKSCGSLSFDRQHEGHGGTEAGRITDTVISKIFSVYTPEVVLWYYGTNDVWRNRDLKRTLAGFDRILEGLRKANPKVVVLVAKIVPVSPKDCARCPLTTQTLNEAISRWAKQNYRDISPVEVVDFQTNWNASLGTEDGVHPNDEWGSHYIASTWYQALLPWLSRKTKVQIEHQESPKEQLYIWKQIARNWLYRDN